MCGGCGRLVVWLKEVWPTLAGGSLEEIDYDNRNNNNSKYIFSIQINILGNRYVRR